MKKLFITLFGVAVFAGLLALNTGCKSIVKTDPDTGVSVTNKVLNAAAIIPVIETTVPLAVQVAVAKDSNSVAYFKSVVVVIDTLVNNGTYDAAAVSSALNALKANTSEAQLVVIAGLSIYKSFAAEAAVSKLQSSEILPVLKALSNSIKTGLAFSGVASEGTVAGPAAKVFNVRSGETNISVKVK